MEREEDCESEERRSLKPEESRKDEEQAAVDNILEREEDYP